MREAALAGGFSIWKLVASIWVKSDERKSEMIGLDEFDNLLNFTTSTTTTSEKRATNKQ